MYQIGYWGRFWRILRMEYISILLFFGVLAVLGSGSRQGVDWATFLAILLSPFVALQVVMIPYALVHAREPSSSGSPANGFVISSSTTKKTQIYDLPIKELSLLLVLCICIGWLLQRETK